MVSYAPSKERGKPISQSPNQRFQSLLKENRETLGGSRYMPHGKVCKFRFSKVLIMLVCHFGAAKWSKTADMLILVAVDIVCSSHINVFYFIYDFHYFRLPSYHINTVSFSFCVCVCVRVLVLQISCRPVF